MIFFDNAATGAIKPNCVYEGAINVMKYLSINAGRGSYRLALYADELIYKTRKEICSFFNGYSPERVIFTKNCTEALNVAIFGTLKKGGHVIASAYEHNSVLRPLYNLEDKGLITLTIVKPQNGAVLKEDILNAITPKTYLVCLTGASNVTGEINDYEAIGSLLKQKGILFLVDGAQIAGHAFIDLKEQNIDIFCFSGHKGMDALQGVGCLIFNKELEIKPLTFGGSGSETFSKTPSGYPELLESGTLNLPSIISLFHATVYTKKNFTVKQKLMLELTDYAVKNLKKIKGVKLYSKQNPIGIVALSYNDYYTPEIAGVLGDKFDIATRGGFHCAPLCHELLNTKQNGLLRLSFSWFNDKKEIDYFIEKLLKVPLYVY
ncbi:MAG: aminotransferase class V-fold PLP-dependent enzyme [Clostridia bacterium]|nr:aminotransferase class V-fold PLP-dependent enzyme [Clostridia bacterium]